MKAQSNPARAFAAIPPGLCRVALNISQNLISNSRGSVPIRTGFKSSMVPATPFGERPSLHSPQPVIPSSVSTLTNPQGLHPASTIKFSMLVIFIYNILQNLPIKDDYSFNYWVVKILSQNSLQNLTKRISR